MIKAAQGDIFEITLGEIAQEKASERLAKKFGRRMIKDHSKGLEELQELAKKKGVELPDEPSEDQKVVIRYFKNSQSQDWDYDYLKYEVYDHKHDIAETKKEIEEGCDEDVKEEARKDLPVLKEHLELAKEYSDKLEQSSSSGSGSDESSDSSARGQAYP
jgi:putative membrane protein